MNLCARHTPIWVLTLDGWSGFWTGGSLTTVCAMICSGSLNGASHLQTEEKHQVLDTWVGYLNALYSGSLEVPFASIRPIQYDVLIYAIAHKKKRFLHMVSEHFEDFCKLGRESFLLEESFYTRCNLNALNGKDFLACAGEAGQRNNLDLLEQREYTFQELKLLCYAKPVYIQFYGMLADIGVDRKLVVMRELLKGDLLNMQIAEEDLCGLAALLSQKPLSVWRQKELGHIAGLSATDAVRVLLVYDKIKLLIPELLTWEDALFASRNADRMRGYQSWTQMRNDLIYVDQDWVALAKNWNLARNSFKTMSNTSSASLWGRGRR